MKTNTAMAIAELSQMFGIPGGDEIAGCATQSYD